MSQSAELAVDITMVLGDLFAGAAVDAFAACEDLQDPLSPNQKKQVVGVCMATIIQARTDIERLIALDGLAKELFRDSQEVEFSDVGFDD